MFHLPDALMITLSRHIDLSKSRLETFATLIIGCVCARTVNLSHIAGQFDTAAQIASNYRRLQRFFQFIRIDQDWLARVLLALIGTQPPYTLCLDRTNWKIGRTDINLLVLCVAARRVRIPLMWTVVNKAGTSNLAQQQRLIRRALRVINAGAISALLADREFTGGQWFDFLQENNIPFVIRVKENRLVRLASGKTVSLASLFRRHKHRRCPSTYRARFEGDETGHELWFAAKRLAGQERQLIIVATTLEPGKGLALYRKRWQIECLFGDSKTRGLNLEDTRLTNPKKLETLIAVVALALVWSHLTATRVKGLKNIKRASHGYRRKSWFRTGFDTLRQWIIHQPAKAADVWTQRWRQAENTLNYNGVV